MTIQLSLSPILLYTQGNAALQQMLAQANYPLLTATDIDAAHLLIQQKHPRIILVDTIENCQRLHTLTPCPILFIGAVDDMDAAFAAGAADCLTKPIHPRLLQERVQCLLRDTFADFDNIPIMIQSLDEARNIQYVNQHWLQIMGYERDEVIGQPFRNFVESSAERVNKRISRFREKGYLRDEALQLRLKDGRTIDALLDANFFTDAETPYSITVIRDISTLKQTENMMQQSQQQMQSILNAMTDVVLVLDGDSCIRQVVTPNQKGMLFTLDELLNKTFFDLVTYDRASRFVATIKQVLASGEVARLDYDLWVNQQQHWFSTSVSPLDEKHVVWVSRNVTTSKQAENSLRESEGRYRNLFEMATEGILIITLPDGQIVEANPHICQLLDFKRDEILTMNISEIEVAQTFEESSSQPDSKKFKHFVVSAVYKHRDGRHIPVETSSRIIQYQDKPAILCFTRDVNERNRALQAEQEQRMLAEALRDTAAAFNSTVNVDDILDIVMEHSSHIVPRINSANIMMLDKGVINIVRHSGYEEAGYSKEVLQEIHFRVDEIPNLRWVRQKRRVLVIGDTHNSQFSWADTQTSNFVRSIVTAPIIVDDEVIGFINLDSNQVNTFSDEHGERLQAFANQAAIAIKNARLFEKIKRDAEELDKSVQQRTIALSNANRALRQQIIQRQEAEAKLLEEQALLKTLVDNIPDSVTVKDANGRIILLNQAAKNVVNLVTGLPVSDDFISKTVGELHPDQQISTRLTQREMRVIQHGESIINEEDNYTTRNADKHWILITKVPLRDADGEIIGLIAINRDITVLKQAQAKLEEERTLLRTLVDTIPDTIYVKDRNHRFILVNQAALKRRGLKSVVDMQGKTDFDFNAPTYAEMTNVQERTILEDGKPLFNMPHTAVHSDGSTHHMLITKLPLRDAEGNIIGLVGTNRDITELRRTEQQLEQVLTSVRCLLWSAKVVYDEDDNSYTWETRIANEKAAQTFLPLETQHTSYTEAWLASIAPEDLQQREALFKAHIEHQQSDYSHEIRSQVNGRTIWLSEDVRIRVISENQWDVVGVCTDISERKQVAMQLQRYNEELEARVAERTAAIAATHYAMEQEIMVRKRAEEAERTQRILAEALRDSVAAINQTLDRDSVLDTLLATMASVVPHDAASIMLLEAPNRARVVRQTGHPSIENNVYDITSWTNLQHIIKTGEPFATDNTRQLAGWSQVKESRWIRSNISVPIILEKEVIGFLNLDSKQPHRFTEQHAEWLFAFAHQAGTAIRNARLVEAIRSDALTLQQRVDEQTAALQSERAQLEGILNAMLDGVIYQADTLSNTPEYTNPALTTITGFTQDEWLDGTAQREINISDRAEREALFRRIERVLEHQGYWEGESTFRRRNGRTFDAALIRSDVRDSTGKRQGIVTVVRDISQAKELEEQKARFIASASHELRTPIANMKTRLFLMKRVPERFMEHIAIAESVAEHMQKLVEDMFDISRFQRGLIPIRPETMILQDVIRQISAYQEPEAERQQITMELDMPDAPIQLEADPFRLSQVLINLLKNALNYTPVAGTIRVVAQVEGDEAVIQVIDTGIGIAAEALPQLFQPFFRLTEDNKGAGLGLSITKEIVQAHSGTITVESTVGEGSCFTVRLPLTAHVKSTEMER